ncbi:oxidoreductase [Oryzibacter oryziterrae]|uniref:oxidoreductase n=1 Tax=Oryzibacter oryziterrae TaxID=2766474 RepID=UPI001F39845B|nr:NADH:flavin oxidoreductase [Oryzibacter oryziterrae]
MAFDARRRDPLLEPFTLKGVTFRNRLLSTAHEPAFTEDGLPKARYRLYHAEKAKGGIGLTMIGGSAVVAPDSPQAFGNILLYKDECVRWLSELADDVHDKGAAVMIQVTHLGRRTTWAKADWLPILAPSSVREAAHRAYPKAMEDWDIARVITAYADAAEKVKAAGLDGLELECYGHLIDQFWSPLTNRRDDDYGGSLDNRMRFGNEVMDAIRDRVGPDFIVGVRMVADEVAEGGITAPEGLEIARRLTAAGRIDFINVIRGHIDTEEGLSHVIPGMGAKANPHLEFAGEVRAAARVATFHASRIQDVASARYAIEAGKLDMVGMTRAHLADPHIGLKLASGREHEIRPCVGMGYCIDSIYNGEAVCIHNAATGREAKIPHVLEKSTGPRRRIVVVGGGPGGLEAARIGAERGHQVILLEAADELGGQVRLTAQLNRRKEILGIVDWRQTECERLGVDLRLNCYAEAADVLALDPDVVVIATGGLPNLSMLAEGADLATSSWDLLSGAAKPAGKVLVYDENGGHAGLTAAEFAATAGAEVELVTPERSLAPDVGGTAFPPYMKVLSEHNTTIGLTLRLTGIRRAGNQLTATFVDDFARRKVERSADMIVVEAGTTPLDELYFSLRPLSSNLGEVDQAAVIAATAQTVLRNRDGRFQLFRIGDAVAGRNIHAAILDAVRLLKDL